MRKPLATLTVLTFFAAPCHLHLSAQNTRETLTNLKVIEMVRLGLGETLIVAKIKKSICRCDTSTGALARLKAARVSDAVILAMVESAEIVADGPEQFPTTVIPAPKSPAKPPEAKIETAMQPSANSSVLSQLSEAGIYFYDGLKMTAIEPAIFSGQKTSLLGSMLTYGIKSSKIRAVVRGKSANLQIAKSRPEFYFVFGGEASNNAALMSGTAGTSGATSPAEFILVEMRVRENSREAILGKANAFGTSMGTPDKLIKEYSFEKLKSGHFKVVPRSDLPPGEYCFYYAGVGGGGKLFDFSVK